MLLIAYYLAFCVICCAILVGVMRRDKRRTDHSTRSSD